MRIQFNFRGTVVAVTGASGGIGKAIAMEFARAGASVLVGDIKEVEGQAAVAEMQALGAQAMFVRTDVLDQKSTDDFIQTAICQFGALDVLVNGAGASGRFAGMPLTRTEDKDFDIAYGVNLKGIYHTIKSGYNYFVGRKEGKIINVTSVVGHSTNPALPHYAASKAAAINFTLTMAKELGPHNIKVNSVCPGYIYTPMYEMAADDMRVVFPAFADLSGEEIVSEFAKANCALGRPQTLEDLANAVMYLASEAGDNITGVVLDVAGGYKL